MIDGIRETRRAIDAGVKLTEVFLNFSSSTDSDRAALLAIASALQVPTFELSDEAFAKISFGNRNEGIVAVADSFEHSLSNLKLSACPLILVLDGIEKPGNIGAVFRTASAAGVDAIFLTNELCNPLNPNAIRASLGTVFGLPFISCSVSAAKHFFEQNRIRPIATRIDGHCAYTEFDYTQSIGIVLGSEDQGVHEEWKDIESVTIPMKHSVDSLNISATAAIFSFEANRQRNQIR